MKRPQLFLLHFAGGSCYSFQFIVPFLKEFDVIVPELPGRGKRAKESLLKDFDAAAKDIYNQIIHKLGLSEFVIYGHSMGSLLGLEVTHMLEKEGKAPACLIVSGNAGPGAIDVRNRHLMDREKFIKELEKLGGVPPELIRDEELFDIFEPILRADFEIAERNRREMFTPVNIPIYAIMGNLEKRVMDISNWSGFTTTQFGFEVLEGDHFFIRRHPRRIAGIIKEWYNKFAINSSMHLKK